MSLNIRKKRNIENIRRIGRFQMKIGNYEVIGQQGSAPVGIILTAKIRL
jgi:hypothetical protein